MAQFCMDHWERLRAAIKDRGLETLVSESGEQAATKLKRELEEGTTIDTFDPLMAAHNTIMANVIRIVGEMGGNPLYLLGSGDEDPVQGYPGYEGRTWPRCPVCYINLGHEVSCSGCSAPKETGFDWMIDRAADDSLVTWHSLKP